MDVVKSIVKNKVSLFLSLFLLFLLYWWFRILALGLKEVEEVYYFGGIYALVALIGGLYGLIISRRWGGLHSAVGKGIIYYSLGLLSLWFGQTMWTYYNLSGVEVPYPSIADLGYFAIVPFYGMGTIYFARATGASVSLKFLKKKIVIVAIPFAMLFVSYIIYLKDISPDFTDPLKTFFDFGQPLGEAVVISLALITFELSRGVLGGKMKPKMLLFSSALVVQYVTDYTFYYRSATETYYNGGPVDLMYILSFALMALALISMRDYQ